MNDNRLFDDHNYKTRGDGLAQWLQRWHWRSKGLGFEPARQEHKTTVSFSESKRLCCLAVGVPNPRVYTHAYERPGATHVKDPG